MRRDAVLNDIANGSDTVTAARNEGMEVHEFGAVTAAVTGWLIVEGRSKGVPFTHRYRFTDTWVKRKAGWEIVAAQDYLAPK
jgi:ketosteroid isomerase-like protein